MKWSGEPSDKRLYCHELSLRVLGASEEYSPDLFMNPPEFQDWLEHVAV